VFVAGFHVAINMDLDHLVGCEEAIADALLQGIRVNRRAEIIDVGNVFRFLGRGGEADLRRGPIIPRRSSRFPSLGLCRCLR
jgi:hypothetical protein